jgi:CelD/BcsL family acetyltransferase involved in cellulose biosynthesis
VSSTPSVVPTLRLREIRTLGELEKAQEPWTRLIERVESATPFQTWEWVFEFARFDNMPLRVGVFEDSNGEWAGVLPLGERRSAFPGVRVAELIGGRLSDYPGMLVDPRHIAACENLARAWLGRFTSHRIMYLRSQRAGLPAWAPRGPFEVLFGEDTVIVRLADTHEKFSATLSAKFRSNLRRNERRLAGKDARFCTPATEAELRAEMPVLFELHQARKNSQGERGRFFDPRWRNAVTEIAVRLLCRGVTNLTILRIDGVPAAASFDLRLHRTQYTYQFGMNPELLEFSPGKLLTWRMLQDAVAAGMQTYDFGRGLEEYKLQWSKERRPVEDLIIARSAPVLKAWMTVQHIHQSVLRSRGLKKIYLATVGRLKGPRPWPGDQPKSE